MMPKIYHILFAFFALFLCTASWAFIDGTFGTSDLSSPGFMFNASEFFPTGGDDGEPADGLENINFKIDRYTPIVVLLMGTFATIVIVIGGVMLTTASGKAENAQKAKTIITTAILALIIGLAAYVIIAFIGNFIDT